MVTKTRQRAKARKDMRLPNTVALGEVLTDKDGVVFRSVDGRFGRYLEFGLGDDPLSEPQFSREERQTLQRLLEEAK